MKKKFLAGISILIFWEILALIIHNDIYLPYPIDVFKAMLNSVIQIAFYQNVLYTVTRTVISVTLAYLVGFALALVSYKNQTFRKAFFPFHLLTKSIPNISYIIIALIWLGPTASGILIIFLIVFPIFYSNILESLDSIDEDYVNIRKVYSDMPIKTLLTVEIKMISVSLLNSLRNGFALGLKVGIMSELIGQNKYGIGRELNYYRMYLDMTNIFNYTLWIILLLYAIDKLFAYIIERERKEFRR